MSSPWSSPGRTPPINFNGMKGLPPGLVTGGAVVIGLVLLVLSTSFTIDQGRSGGDDPAYGRRRGRGQNRACISKLPIVTTIEKISVQIQKVAFERTADGDTRLQAYSRDQQPATIAMAVNYHVTDASAVYAQYGSLANMRSRIIDSRAYEQLKNVFGQFDAADAIQKRALLNAEVFAAIHANRSAARWPIDSVQIEDISFSSQYEAAVAGPHAGHRQAAAGRSRQARKRIIDADASAYEVKAAADAKAHQIEVQGKAEAGAIQARGDALRNNPTLPTLVAAEKWNGVLPTTMVPGNTVPFLNIAK